MKHSYLKRLATNPRFFRPPAFSYTRSFSVTMAANGSTTNGVRPDNRKVFFFDIDNCLYPKSYQIHDKMAVLIDNYFQNHLSLSPEDATVLHQRYYKDYGLAIEGLVRHHKVDPLEYNEKVDDALPLDDIIKPDPKLRKLLQDLDPEKVRLWLFTNAYVNHGKRVTRLLGVDDLFDGMTFCDYGAERLLCKPSKEMYDKAMKEANAPSVGDCYFVGSYVPDPQFLDRFTNIVPDDSALNAGAAKTYGWKTAHLVEPTATPPPEPVSQHQISNLEELRKIFPEIFKSS